MQTKLQPYIGFNDNARQAMTFYQSIFGGKLDIHTFDEFGGAEDPGDAGKVMHAMLEAEGISFMASDRPSKFPFIPPAGFSMSLSGDNESELRGYWDRLRQGGEVTMPLEPQVWGDTFGMVTDKFGISWMVNISGVEQDASAPPSSVQ